jgi:hypothetical protein
MSQNQTVHNLLSGHVLEDAPAPWTTDYDRLVDVGAVLPAPSALSDRELTAKLWELIGRLAGLGIYLTHTDHLSDRELYHELWTEVLREETPNSYDDVEDGCWVVDLVGRGSNDEVRTWLRFYATERERAAWFADFPEEAGIARESPPFARDRLLPAPMYCYGGAMTCSVAGMAGCEASPS